jgi:hypothetical protein
MLVVADDGCVVLGSVNDVLGGAEAPVDAEASAGETAERNVTV